jgi:hypothetical protein
MQKLKKLLNNLNAGVILDMTYDQLIGVECDYVDPETFPEIQWVVNNSSFSCKENGVSGIYDFIFNLSMLDDFHSESAAPLHLFEQLKALQIEGYSYILFNQGC